MSGKWLPGGCSSLPSIQWQRRYKHSTLLVLLSPSNPLLSAGTFPLAALVLPRAYLPHTLGFKHTFENMWLHSLTLCLLAVSTRQAVAQDNTVPQGTTLTTVVISEPTSDLRADATDPPYWLKDIQKQGIAAFNPNPQGYKVFRNVKDYGAIGKFLAWICVK